MNPLQYLCIWISTPPPPPRPSTKSRKKRILLQVLVPKLQALVKNAHKYDNIHLKTVKWPKLSLIVALYQKTESCNLYNVGCYDLQQKEDNDEKKKFCFTSSVSPICWPSWLSWKIWTSMIVDDCWVPCAVKMCSKLLLSLLDLGLYIFVRSFRGLIKEGAYIQGGLQPE